jgi:hypothetical protein
MIAGQQLQEVSMVFVVSEDDFAVVIAVHDMISACRRKRLLARLARHR